MTALAVIILSLVFLFLTHQKNSQRRARQAQESGQRRAHQAAVAVKRAKAVLAPWAYAGNTDYKPMQGDFQCHSVVFGTPLEDLKKKYGELVHYPDSMDNQAPIYRLNFSGALDSRCGIWFHRGQNTMVRLRGTELALDGKLLAAAEQEGEADPRSYLGHEKFRVTLSKGRRGEPFVPQAIYFFYPRDTDLLVAQQQPGLRPGFNIYAKQFAESGRLDPTAAVTLDGIELGWSQQQLLEKLGEPTQKNHDIWSYGETLLRLVDHKVDAISGSVLAQQAGPVVSTGDPNERLKDLIKPLGLFPNVSDSERRRWTLHNAAGVYNAEAQATIERITAHRHGSEEIAPRR